MLSDILNSQKTVEVLTPEQLAFQMLDSIGEPIVRKWLMHKALEQEERHKAVKEVTSTEPTYEILEEVENEREADYHEPN